MTYAETPPTEAELEELVNDLNYEIWMFHELATIELPEVGPISEGGAVVNAVIEAILVHCRCLMDFFGNSPKKDDVVAGHFVPDWDPVKDGGAELAWLEEHLGVVIDKRVAHLTAYRQRVPKEETAELVMDVFNAVVAVVKRFHARLPASWKRLVLDVEPVDLEDIGALYLKS